MALETVLPDTYNNYVGLCTRLKTYLTDLNTAMASDTTSGNNLIILHNRIIGDMATLTTYSQVTGIGAYVATQQSTTSGAIATAFTNLITAMTALRNYIVSQNASLGNAWLTFTNSGVDTKSFSTAQTATIRTYIQAVIDEIN